MFFFFFKSPKDEMMRNQKHVYRSIDISRLNKGLNIKLRKQLSASQNYFYNLYCKFINVHSVQEGMNGLKQNITNSLLENKDSYKIFVVEKILH